MRHLLAGSLAQAAAALEKQNLSFLAPSFPGMTAPEDCRLIEAPLLAARQDGDGDALAHWPAQGLLATQWPTLVFVLDGECDFRFGITDEMGQRLAAQPSPIGQYVVTAQRDQFLLLPSHFPRPDGSGIHWERPHQPGADSTLMWFIPFPAGCFVHFCRTQQQEHTATRSIYLPMTRTVQLLHNVEHEILEGQAHWHTVVHSSLEMLIAFLRRQVGGAQFGLGLSRAPARSPKGTELPNHASHLVLQTACTFIEDHLQEALLVTRIAAVVGISASSLNHLFRRYLQSSITQYIIRRRIERAKTLLAETNLAVRQVAFQCGFPHVEHFSRTFRRTTGVSPLAYRQHQQPE